ATPVLPAGLAGAPPPVAAPPSAAQSTSALQQAGLAVRPAADDAAAEQAVREGDADAAVLAGPRVIALDEEPRDVVDALSSAPRVQLLEPSDTDPFVQFVVPFALAFVFFLTSFTFGLQIAQSVTEEKQTRVVEILVAAVPPRALLAGKVAAMTLLAFGQIALIGLVAIAGMRIADVEPAIFGVIGPAIGWFIPFFVVGFLMLAALWAGVGALAARQEDLAGVSAPLQMAIMIPFFLTIFLSDKPAAVAVMSYFPLTAPAAMPVRWFNGDAAIWEPFASLLVLAATAVVLLAVGARIYEGSLLRTNGRTSFATAWRTRSVVS
ncbi:ABC transporter permease, partial [Actinoplanes sp. NPDC051633]|uniref:ABC transporter permease n=1 Tax=Actinoplanes sp. NPDC051633 TaxID=3155670 RepID=UPI00342A9F16